MARTFEQILEAFDALTYEDFDCIRRDSNGIGTLYALTEELMALPQPERAIRPMFELMERLPASDLGSPGPLVHTLEKMEGRYEAELVESIRRKPTPLSVWMVNRILNVTNKPRQREFYLDLLRLVIEHPEASETEQDQAERFIEHQANRKR
ncbi:hypothetical protein [Verrucomicrobium sp. BvORR106]|uniref:hypothetical protein n=1 Tax=Verrucomicrobium sp. BvORR106 TaxID=1403819 RepID=UPI0006925EF7|nr:hypothetical protein [Verrucomicrobium sp. BvORR106]